jgi:TPR repeat protein
LIGEGVPKDPSKAFFWCEKAADLGFSIALNNLGYYFYRTGLVVSKDGHKAFELYTKAAANGNAPAMVNLGASYEDGFGVPRNLKQAIYWYRQAASKGQVEGKDALNRLGYSE